jgi:para-nitrobenzyl esterase
MKLGAVGPYVDGRLIPQSVPKAFASGQAIDVPLIIGSNSYEASLAKNFKLSPAALIASIPNTLRSLYPADEQQATDQAFTDIVMGAPARWIATEASAGAPSWLYHFSYVPAWRRGRVPGASHGSEIPFVFGSWPKAFRLSATGEDKAMETLMHACWISFAKNGDPVCGKDLWPAYTRQKDILMEFGTVSGPIKGFRKAQYDGIEQTVLKRRMGGAQ